jgi:hypothetical protein
MVDLAFELEDEVIARLQRAADALGISLEDHARRLLEISVLHDPVLSSPSRSDGEGDRSGE